MTWIDISTLLSKSSEFTFDQYLLNTDHIYAITTRNNIGPNYSLFLWKHCGSTIDLIFDKKEDRDYIFYLLSTILKSKKVNLLDREEVNCD